MRHLSSLERRVETIENSTLSIDGLDPDVFVLDILTDNELGILEEFRSLHRAGYDMRQIVEKMGPESYELLIEVGQKMAKREQLLPLHLRH